MTQPLPATQNRWNGLLTIVSPPTLTRNVGLGGLWWIDRDRLVAEGAGLDVLGQYAVADADGFDRACAVEGADQGAPAETAHPIVPDGHRESAYWQRRWLVIQRNVLNDRRVVPGRLLSEHPKSDLVDPPRLPGHRVGAGVTPCDLGEHRADPVVRFPDVVVVAVDLRDVVLQLLLCESRGLEGFEPDPPDRELTPGDDGEIKIRGPAA